MADYDLVSIWDAHTRCEFETRDVDATMATMVDDPYVNHVPTMAGGVGHDELKRFYKYHFIGNNPPDTTLTPISRTVGVDQIVDEMLFSFTHTSAIDWMLPGVAPTGRRVEVALVAIVRIRDGKIAHEPHLLGPGLGAGAGRPARPSRPAGAGGGGRAKGGGQHPAEQPAVGGRVGAERGQADLATLPAPAP